MNSAFVSNGAPMRERPTASRGDELPVLSPNTTATPSVPLPHSTGLPSRLLPQRVCSELTTQVQDRWPLCVTSTPPKQGKSWANTSMQCSSSARTRTFMSLRNALNLPLFPCRFSPACVRWGWRASEVFLSVDMLRGGGPTCRGFRDNHHLLTGRESANPVHQPFWAQVPPLEKQILATEEHIARAKKRLLQHDATIAEVDVQGVADGEDLLQKLQQQLADPAMHLRIPLEKWPVFSKWSWICNGSCSNMVFLWSHRGVPVVPSPISPFQIRKRGDYVPATEHEVLEWMADRHEDMTAALMARNPTEAACISSLITDATRSLHPESVPPSMVTNMVR